jgi:flagellar basal body P-ring protein FlgI
MDIANRWILGAAMARIRSLLAFFLVETALLASDVGKPGEVHKVLIRDIASVEGVRDNALVGYGLVVGLKGTGDRQQTYFTVQTWPASWPAWECRFLPRRCA